MSLESAVILTSGSDIGDDHEDEQKDKPFLESDCAAPNFVAECYKHFIHWGDHLVLSSAATRYLSLHELVSSLSSIFSPNSRSE